MRYVNTSGWSRDIETKIDDFIMNQITTKKSDYKHMIARSDDSICLSCQARGLCCYPEYTVKGKRLVLMDEPCEFLDISTGLCTIYLDRQSREERTGNPCLTIQEMLAMHTVPVSCRYVTDKAAYRKCRDRRHYTFKVVLND